MGVEQVTERDKLEVLFNMLPAPVLPSNYASMYRLGYYLREVGVRRILGEAVVERAFQAILHNVRSQEGLVRPLLGKSPTAEERIEAASQGPPPW